MALKQTLWGVGAEPAFPTISAGTSGFREVCAKVEEHILDAGLIRVPCTGELDLDTYVLPGGYLTNTRYGFRCYRFNDINQVAAPIFVRIGFGIQGNVGDVGIWVTVGSELNTSDGVIGGRLAPVQSCSVNNTSTLARVYSAGSSARIGLLGVFGSSASRVVSALAIERTKNASGGDTRDGFVVVSGPNVQYVSFASSPVENPPIENSWNCIVSSFEPSSHLNNRSFGLVIPFNGDTENPLISLGIGRQLDYAIEESVTANIYGLASLYFVPNISDPLTSLHSMGSGFASRYIMRID